MVKLMKKVKNGHGYNEYVELGEEDVALHYEQMLKRGVKKDGVIRLGEENKRGIKKLPEFIMERIPKGWFGRLFPVQE